MAVVQCIFCKTETDGTLSAGYCDGCGRKLPTTALIKTRRAIATGANAGNAEGELRQGNSVVEGLAMAAIVHLFLGGLFLVVGPYLLGRIEENFLPQVLSWTLIPTITLGILAGLARWWAKPVVLASVGLVLLWTAATFFMNAAMATGWLLVQLILLALLIVPGRAAFLSRS
jgi:hypothetical protein